MTPITNDQKAAIKQRCTRFLSFENPRSATDWLTHLAASPALDLALDSYSNGPAIERLEQQIATLLGKQAALWFPKGIIAQQAALLVHAQTTGRKTIALHPKSHLALDEANAIERLAGLTAIRTGKDYQHFAPADLDQIAEPLAAITLELPLRRSGFLAPSWDELTAIAAWARAHGTPFHLDGARLWETQPWYNKPLAEIAALADSLYVSLYKGLGGMSGSILAGSASLIAAAKLWRLRFGGDLPLAFPFIVSALDGLANTLPLMPQYHQHACTLAAAIHATPGLSTLPHPPHCNSFQVHFQAPAAALHQAALAHAQNHQTWLFGWFEQASTPVTAYGEIVVGSATLDWSIPDILTALISLQSTAQTFACAT
jgi:threonine aldolase